MTAFNCTVIELGNVIGVGKSATPSPKIKVLVVVEIAVGV